MSRLRSNEHHSKVDPLIGIDDPQQALGVALRQHIGVELTRPLPMPMVLPERYRSTSKIMTRRSRNFPVPSNSTD